MVEKKSRLEAQHSNKRCWGVSFFLEPRSSIFRHPSRCRDRGRSRYPLRDVCRVRGVRLRLRHREGRLRRTRVLLDENDDIRLADFDASVKSGAELLVASEPISKMNENFGTPLPGPESEQFLLALCIYTIRFGHWPFHDLEPEVRFQRLIRNEFPPVSSDHLFGEVTRQCWLGEYESVAAVELDVLSRLGWTDTGAEARGLEALNKEDAARHLVLRAECEGFIAGQVRT